MIETAQQYSLGMVFGVFDGLHEGHQHFLLEALKHCQKLIVVVAHPKIVLSLKQRLPKRTLEERIVAIQSFNPVLQVIAGDTALGTWSALKHHQPNIVLLGYDQERLGQELEKIGVPSLFISSHSPEKFKSSLLDQEKSGSVS